MSAPYSYGLTSLTFGTTPFITTGYVIKSTTLANKNGINAEVFNETGQRVAVRYDDLITEISVEAILQGATLPAPGTTMTLNSILYEVLSVDQKFVDKDFLTVSIKAKKSANLSLS